MEQPTTQHVYDLFNGRELAKRSLLINQRLCQYDEWNEQLIDERGGDLAERVLRIWP